MESKTEIIDCNDDRPVYDWEYAVIGHQASPVLVEIVAEKILQYGAAQRDANPAFRLDAGKPLGVPPVMVRVYAPLRRRELVEQKGARYPNHPTPAVHWRCQILDTLRAGDRIESVTRVSDKYVKNGRHFLAWQVQAKRGATTVALFEYVNLWDRGRPEDKNR
ncbi:MAG: hypothetical protein EXR28_00455 [Betaproteobacteria bacterium]|nr:hypothetical protein [Betaproteobacteria bacterium]